MLSGDIEPNPGPRIQYLSICQWNLNCVWVDDFAKKSSIEVFLNSHKFDIFCGCETFLDSTIEDEDERLKTDGYELLLCYHPSNSKK